ncbi:hypothetical protein BT96DRAFT_1079765 [Gymnopus androsaceus JB14]|uniref:Uncharacterized protein n=1 Tax=Gymnopus androsaceus JB14 TaxID=1447944 RepID=A0A6A4GQ72_9AGAR|nr:hypothetical protein BT96DRAFT_1079765 [Gymnopus androsaceus JB14]
MWCLLGLSFLYLPQVRSRIRGTHVLNKVIGCRTNDPFDGYEGDNGHKGNDQEPESDYNNGQGVRYEPVLTALFPHLPAGQKHRQNAARPKVTGKTFFISEYACMGEFMEEVTQCVKGLGNSPVPWDFKIVAGDFRSSSFKVIWSIHGKQGLLADEAGYNDMLKQTKGSIKLSIEELELFSAATRTGTKQNLGPELEPATIVKKKGKKKHESSEEEDKILEFIDKLITHHTCNNKSCCSSRCLVDPTGKHVPLTMYRICLWAAAMVAHTANVDIDNPLPGIEVENNNDNDDIGMLAKRPTIHFHCLLNYLCDFCTKYDLSDEILPKLDAVKITGPHTLHFYKEADLMDTVKLTLGELGSVLDAAE